MAVPAIVLTPFPSPSHYSPFLDLAHLLINNSFIIYIAGTPSTIKSIEPSFPSNPSLIYVELPVDDDEDDAPYHTLPLEKRRRFNDIIQNLKPSFEQWLESAIQLETPKIVSVVSDFFVDWAPHSAAKFGISGVFFHTSSVFSTSILRAFVMDYLNGDVEIEGDEITLGNLPAPMKLNSKQVTMCFFRHHTINEHTLHALKCEMNAFTSNWGVLFNTMEELETPYLHFFRSICEERKAKVLPIGPIHIKHDHNSPLIENLTNSDENTHVLNWLDSKEKRSVLYVSFGTLSSLSKKQVENLVLGLKSANTHVILRVKCQDDQTLDDILEDYEEVGDGSTCKPWLMIRDFAPQRLILSHRSVGGFMTHCGWNSVLESIANGVPMACWPMVMDQQPNSMFVCDVLRIGVQFCEHIDGNPNLDKVRDAVELVMKGKEFTENVTKWKQVVREAVEDGGSSAGNIEVFIEDMRRLVTNRPSTAGTTDN